jgi:hypothetical protein
VLPSAFWYGAPTVPAANDVVVTVIGFAGGGSASSRFPVVRRRMKKPNKQQAGAIDPGNPKVFLYVFLHREA